MSFCSVGVMMRVLVTRPRRCSVSITSGRDRMGAEEGDGRLEGVGARGEGVEEGVELGIAPKDREAVGVTELEGVMELVALMEPVLVMLPVDDAVLERVVVRVCEVVCDALDVCDEVRVLVGKELAVSLGVRELVGVTEGDSLEEGVIEGDCDAEVVAL